MIRSVLIFYVIDLALSFECFFGCSCQPIRNLNTLTCADQTFQQIPAGISNSSEILRFEKNEIERIPRNLSSIVPNLQVIDLSENKITILEKGTFANLKKLNSVKLMRNKIQVLKEFIFEGVESTDLLLNLRDNNISLISKDAFTGMHADTHVHMDLSKNSLKDLHKDTFKDISLSSLNLAENQLVTIEDGLFKNQDKIFLLKLRENKLQDLRNNSFLGLAALETLDLTGNNLRSLPAALFQFSPELFTIKLSSNQFKYPPTSFPDRVNRVTLEDNPIHCDCKLKEILLNADLKSKLKDIDRVKCFNDSKTTSEALALLDCRTTTPPPTTTTMISLVGSVAVSTTQRPTVSQTIFGPASKRNWPIIVGSMLGVVVVLVILGLFAYLYRESLKTLLGVKAFSIYGRSHEKKPCTTSADDFEFHGWSNTSTAMLAKSDDGGDVV